MGLLKAIHNGFSGSKLDDADKKSVDSYMSELTRLTSKVGDDYDYMVKPTRKAIELGHTVRIVADPDGMLEMQFGPDYRNKHYKVIRAAKKMVGVKEVNGDRVASATRSSFLVVG